MKRTRFLVVNAALFAVAAATVAQVARNEPTTRQLERDILGEVVVNAPNAVVAVRRDARGHVQRVTVTTPDVKNMVEVTYTPATRPSLSYSVTPDFPEPGGWAWYDWNGDGKFDQRLRMGSTSTDTAPEILLDEVWVKGVGLSHASEHLFRVGNVTFRFDPSTGTWKPK